MKVVNKQRNSKMCAICGMDNKYGVHAQFYSMEDGSVMSKFKYREEHQSYPGRVHGGLITAMLDEMGLRALWAKEGNEEEMGVTVSLDTKYRKPVPYNTELIGKGVVVKNNNNFLIVESKILDLEGNVLANGTIKYIKLDANKINDDMKMHEEMCYLIEDDIKEI